MRLQVNEQIFEVDISALRQRAAAGMEGLIADKGDKNPILRQAVKAACQYAMNVMGLAKKDRNDDPIKLVAVHVAGLIFDGIEKEGLTVAGTLVPMLEAPIQEDENQLKMEIAEAPKE